jgi:hypothetical protein
MTFRTSLVVAGLVLAGAGTATGWLAGCNAVLGIGDAQLEPDAGAATVEPDSGEMILADPLTCDNYCTVIGQNCQGEFQEYLPGIDGGNDLCEQICQIYLAPLSQNSYPYYSSAGTEPPNENSLGCRLWHAHAAGIASTGGPATHCRHAGPLGSTLCGGPIAPFCGLDWTFCTDDHGIFVYDGGTSSACQDTLGGVLAANPGFYEDQDSGDINDPLSMEIQSGNTLNCRLWHLETGMREGDPVDHCPHTGYPSAVSDSDAAGPCN